LLHHLTGAVVVSLDHVRVALRTSGLVRGVEGGQLSRGNAQGAEQCVEGATEYPALSCICTFTITNTRTVSRRDVTITTERDKHQNLVHTRIINHTEDTSYINVPNLTGWKLLLTYCAMMVLEPFQAHGSVPPEKSEPQLPTSKPCDWCFGT